MPHHPRRRQDAPGACEVRRGALAPAPGRSRATARPPRRARRASGSSRRRRYLTPPRRRRFFPLPPSRRVQVVRQPHAIYHRPCCEAPTCRRAGAARPFGPRVGGCPRRSAPVGDAGARRARSRPAGLPRLPDDVDGPLPRARAPARSRRGGRAPLARGIAPFAVVLRPGAAAGLRRPRGRRACDRRSRRGAGPADRPADPDLVRAQRGRARPPGPVPGRRARARARGARLPPRSAPVHDGAAAARRRSHPSSCSASSTPDAGRLSSRPEHRRTGARRACFG